MLRFSRLQLAGSLLACVLLTLTPAASAQQKSEPLKLTLTTIAVPGYAVTEANGINSSGEIVGTFGQDFLGTLSGFTYSNSGTFTYFDYPGQNVTFAQGINDSGLIVGSATQEAGQRNTILGFLYDGTTFTTLQDGNKAVTDPYGINNAGQVVGSVGIIDSVTGFTESNGKYTAVRLPGPCNLKYATGINNVGEIVGYTVCGIDEYGYAVINGKLHSIQFPGSTQTAVFGVNDGGIAVGWYGKGAFEYAFAYLKGKFISFGYPGAKYTFASGINRSGQVVGNYSFDNQAYYGFVSSPVTSGDFERPGCCQTAIVDGQ